MKFYAIGLVKSATKNRAMEGGGSFKTIIIDGRHTLENAKTLAHDWYRKNKNIEHMIGYRIFKANRLGECKKPLYVHNPSNLPIKEWG